MQDNWQCPACGEFHHRNEECSKHYDPPRARVYCPVCEKLEKDIERLKAENARLREALELIANNPWRAVGSTQIFARSALRETKE